MFTYQPPADLYIKNLYELASVPFTVHAFSERFTSYHWALDYKNSDESCLFITIPDFASLTVDIHDGDVWRAVSTFCRWYPFFRSGYRIEENFVRDRLEFDRLFDKFASDCSNVIGPPSIRWKDNDEDSHSACIWEGDAGIFILQQACFDCIDGIEINFWLAPISLTECKPATPFIDWLTHLEQ